MADFTPGPWKVVTRKKCKEMPGASGAWHFIESLNYAQPIIEVYETDDVSGKEAAANARRMAAETKEQPVMPEEPRTTLTDGRQVYPEHRNRIPDGPRKGQQQDYVVLAEEERAKGFVRPVRRSYKHLKCGVVTTMGQTLAETYARDPQFYSGTFCCGCADHFPVGPDGEFVWDGTDQKVGS